jgi:hypothetical protein
MKMAVYMVVVLTHVTLFHLFCTGCVYGCGPYSFICSAPAVYMVVVLTHVTLFHLFCTGCVYGCGPYPCYPLSFVLHRLCIWLWSLLMLPSFICSAPETNTSCTYLSLSLKSCQIIKKHTTG